MVRAGGVPSEGVSVSGVSTASERHAAAAPAATANANWNARQSESSRKDARRGGQKPIPACGATGPLGNL